MFSHSSRLLLFLMSHPVNGVRLDHMFNDLYSRNISKKVLAGWMTRSRQGKFLGGTTPYGLIRDPKDHGHLFLQKCFDLIVCIHWFNPFVWAARHEFSLSCEMDCDQRIFKSIPEMLASDYANLKSTGKLYR